MGITASQESPSECKAAQGQCGALAAVFDLKEAATYKLWVWPISMHAVLFLIFFVCVLFVCLLFLIGKVIIIQFNSIFVVRGLGRWPVSRVHAM